MGRQLGGQFAKTGRQSAKTGRLFLQYICYYNNLNYILFNRAGKDHTTICYLIFSFRKNWKN